MNGLKGVYAALPTPFDETGAVSGARLRALVRHLVAQGLDGLYVAGSTGEGLMLSEEERLAVFETVAEEAKGKLALIAHVGSIGTDAARRLAVAAKRAGYDATAAIPPIYYPHAFPAVCDYYRALAGGGLLPHLVYNIPRLSGITFSLEELRELLSLDGVVGIKFTATDLYAVQRLKALHPEKLVLFGSDEMVLGAAATGVDGAIGSTYNVLGPACRAVFDAVERGDLGEARRQQNLICEFVDLIRPVGGIPAVKRALATLGVDAGRCRAPLGVMDEAAADALDRWVRENLGGG